MSHLLLVFTILSLATQASADVQFQNFLWKADSGIEVNVLHNRAAKTLKGDLKDGEARELAGEGLNVTVNAHTNSFVTLAFVEAEVENGGLMVLERQNGRYVPLAAMIPGRADTLVKDLNGVIAGLKKMNRWDHSLVFRSMVSYFAANSGKKLNDFYDAVELGHVREMAKPVPRVAAGKQTRKIIEPPPPSANDEERPGEPKQKVAADRSDEAPQRRPRAPQPYDPRYSNNYPGQNMRPQRPPPRRPPPPPRGFLDYFFR